MINKIKQFYENKKREMTLEAFDTVVEDKKEEVRNILKERKELLIGAGVIAGLCIFGLINRKPPAKAPNTVIIIINKGEVNYG